MIRASRFGLAGAIALMTIAIATADAPASYTIAFDEAGIIEPDSAPARDRAIAAAGTATDVFVLSHGWRNDRATAECRYRELMDGIRAALPAQARPLFINVSWPSAVLPLPHDSCGNPDVPRAFERSTAARDIRAWAIAAFPAAAASRRFPSEVGRLVVILETPQTANARELAEAAQILVRWRNAIDGRATAAAADAPDEAPVPVDADAVLRQWQQVQAGRMTADMNPRTWLDFLEVFSFWTMKDRAGTIGSRGVASLLRALKPAQMRGVRIHLVGHSFGGKLLSAALTGGEPNRVDSLTLLQCAMSHLALSSREQIAALGLPLSGEGAYAAILKDRLASIVVATYSAQDLDNRRWFPLGVRVSHDALSVPGMPTYAAIGARGIDGPPSVSVILRDESLAGRERPGSAAVFNVDASDVILGHSDIAKAPVYRLIADAAQLSQRARRPRS